jgi:hypothetical protein
MAKNNDELSDIRELINDVPAALLHEEKKNSNDNKWHYISNYGTEYKFSNKQPDNNIGIGSMAIGGSGTFQGIPTPELVIDITINLSEDMKYDRSHLSVTEKYPTSYYQIQSGAPSNTNHVNLYSSDSPTLKELGELMYHNYIYPTLLAKQRDLSRIVNTISPSYNRTKKINDLLDDDETNDTP